eukprot:6014859-Prymnesium_polylepis.1
MLIIQDKRQADPNNGSSVRVMCNGRPPPDPRNAGPPEVLGNAQPGEILTATMAGFTPEKGSLVYVVYHSSAQPNPNGKLPVGPVNLMDQKLNAAVVPKATLRAVFANFDKNGNGTLTLEELQAALCRPTAAGTAWSEKEVAALMQKLDKNGDGVIDYNEWVTGDVHTALPGGSAFLGKLQVGPVDKAVQVKDKLAACIAEANQQMGLPTQGPLLTQFGALAKALGLTDGVNPSRARCASASVGTARAHPTVAPGPAVRADESGCCVAPLCRADLRFRACGHPDGAEGDRLKGAVGTRLP